MLVQASAPARPVRGLGLACSSPLYHVGSSAGKSSLLPCPTTPLVSAKDARFSKRPLQAYAVVEALPNSVAQLPTPATVRQVAELDNPRASSSEALIEAFAYDIADLLSIPTRAAQDVISSAPALLVTGSAPDIASTVQGLASALRISPIQALKMVSRRPSLVACNPEKVLQRCSEAMVLLNLERDAAVTLYTHQPALLDVPLDVLSEQFNRMAQLLDVGVEDVCVMMRRLKPPMLRTILLAPTSSLRQQLMDLQDVIDSRLGLAGRPADVVPLVVQNPALLALPSKGLALTLDKLAAVFRARPNKLARLCLRCPMLLTMTPTQLGAHFQGVISALRTNPSAVIGMLCFEPRLLQVSPAKMATRMEALEHRLYIPRKQALSMVLRQPSLLLYQEETLAEHMAALGALLGVPVEVVLVVVDRYPRLLTTAPASLEAKLQHLCKLLHLPRVRCAELLLREPGLLTLSIDNHTNTFEGLRAVLQAEPRQLSALVLRNPSLLMQAPATLEERIADAAQLLAAPESAVAAMAVRQPDFMLKADFRHWQTNLDSLSSQLGLTLSKARVLARQYPTLLSADPAWLHAACARLQRVVGACTTWQTSFEAAPPHHIRNALHYGPNELEHLRFIVDRGLQERCSPFNPILYSRTAFIADYPAFEAWQQRKRSSSADGSGSKRSKQSAMRKRKQATRKEPEAAQEAAAYRPRRNNGSSSSSRSSWDDAAVAVGAAASSLTGLSSESKQDSNGITANGAPVTPQSMARSSTDSRQGYGEVLGKVPGSSQVPGSTSGASATPDVMSGASLASSLGLQARPSTSGRSKAPSLNTTSASAGTAVVVLASRPVRPVEPSSDAATMMDVAPTTVSAETASQADVGGQGATSQGSEERQGPLSSQHGFDYN